MKNSSWGLLLAVVVLVCAGIVAVNTAFGPDDSDVLAAKALAAENGWTVVSASKVREDGHDLEVVRIKTESSGFGQRAWFDGIERCTYKSQVGEDAPRAVGTCESIKFGPRDQIANANPG